MSDNISQAEIYRAAKNVIHNDLGITKEYINEIVMKTVKDEICKLVSDEGFIRGLIEKEVMWSLRKKDESAWHIIHDASTFISDEITNTLLQMIKDNVEIKLKDNNYNKREENNYDRFKWE